MNVSSVNAKVFYSLFLALTKLFKPILIIALITYLGTSILKLLNEFLEIYKKFN